MATKGVDVNLSPMIHAQGVFFFSEGPLKINEVMVGGLPWMALKGYGAGWERKQCVKPG